MDISTLSLNSDIISTLPQNILEGILTLMPIRDALRTSVLSKKWRYTWRGMPKLTFTDGMVTEPSNPSGQLMKYKLVSAIFHVLLLHNGPEALEFYCSIDVLDMESEFSQIFSYLAKRNEARRLVFANDNCFYKIPISFFSLQQLENIYINNCTFEPPLTFDGFSRLKSVMFQDVVVSAQMLRRFLTKCPLLEDIHLMGYQQGIDIVAGDNTFTFVDLLQCVPLIRTLEISMSYMKYLCAGCMPHKLPASLVHLKYLYLDVCLMEKNQISFILSIIRSSPMLEMIGILMYNDNEKLPDQQTPTNFFDPEGYEDLKLDHLELLEIEMFSNLPLEMEFVKLIMAKSPVLKKVLIELNHNVSVDEELKMLRDLVQNPIPRASPSAMLTVVRP